MPETNNPPFSMELRWPYPKTITSIDDAVNAIMNLCTDCPRQDYCSGAMAAKCNGIKENIRHYAATHFNKKAKKDILYLLLGSMYTCYGSCQGCPYPDIHPDAIPVCEDFRPYKEIHITGGSPLIYPYATTRAMRHIRKQNKNAKLILHAMQEDMRLLRSITPFTDGLVYTISSKYQILSFYDFDYWLSLQPYRDELSLTLHMREGLNGMDTDLKCPWDVHMGMLPPCVFPEDAAILRLPDTDEAEIH